MWLCTVCCRLSFEMGPWWWCTWELRAACIELGHHTDSNGSYVSLSMWIMDRLLINSSPYGLALIQASAHMDSVCNKLSEFQKYSYKYFIHWICGKHLSLLWPSKYRDIAKVDCCDPYGWWKAHWVENQQKVWIKSSLFRKLGVIGVTVVKDQQTLTKEGINCTGIYKNEELVIEP